MTIPLLNDEFRITCKISFQTPDGDNENSFSMSCHNDLRGDMWRHMEVDIIEWLKSCK